MTDRKRNTKAKIFCILVYIFAFPSAVRGQIAADTTLPVNTIVNSEANNFVIEGGTEVGNNLFHSFQQFSVPTDGTAFFNNVDTIQNIFSRITGGEISNIDGIIKANGTANLFLINPNGIIFGPNSSLNIGGSFLATTASNLIFKDGSQFSATNPQSPPLLTINTPIGLQLGGTPGEITVEGNGHNLIIDKNEAIANNNRPLGLSVNPSNTLALIGGNVNITGGNLTANSGRIELWSVVNGQLSVVSSNGKLTIENGILNDRYGDIQLSNAASLDASGNGGEIQLQGRKVSLRDGSTIFAITQDTEQGGNLAVKASDSVELIGITITADNKLFRSSLLSQSFGEGKGSDLIIETGQLMVDGGQAAAFTFGAGKAGDLTVRAGVSVEIIGTESDGELTNGLFSQVKPKATGNGGNLTVETGRLIVQRGAQISTNTLGDGRGGDIVVRASEFMKLIGSSDDNIFGSAVLTQSEPESNGNSGNLTITTDRLILQDGAEISASTFGTGNAGNLLIRALGSVELSGSSGGIPSGIFAQVNQNTTGNAGNLTIETRQLIVRDGGQISAATFGEGNGGNLVVRGVDVAEADLVELSGISSERQNNGFFAPSGLFATTLGETEKPGAGGNLIVDTRQLIVRDGAQIVASTLGAGAGGTVTVNALESVELRGIGITSSGEIALTKEGDILRSGLLARTRQNGSGKAGNLTINTGQLLIQDGATTTVSTRLGSKNAAAGNITAQANNILLENGIITAETRAGDFGNIELTSNNIQLRRQSSITTNATGTGGNITIDTGVLAALENSDITANSSDSLGGKVNINTEGIFRQGFLGTNISREVSELTSDITATSQLGAQFDGVVNIQTPDIDPTQGLIALPPIESRPVLKNACSVTGDNDEIGEFVDTGRGGLPPNPREALNILTSENPSPQTAIREAQGWVKDAKGVIHLIVEAPKVTAYSPPENVANCADRTPSPISINPRNSINLINLITRIWQ